MKPGVTTGKTAGRPPQHRGNYAIYTVGTVQTCLASGVASEMWMKLLTLTWALTPIVVVQLLADADWRHMLIAAVGLVLAAHLCSRSCRTLQRLRAQTPHSPQLTSSRTCCLMHLSTLHVPKRDCCEPDALYLRSCLARENWCKTAAPKRETMV